MALEKVYEGASFLFHDGVKFSPFEYTGYREELLASKESAWLGTSLNGSPTYDVYGPDAAKFLSSICVNDFGNLKVGSIRHAVICNEKGQIMTDGVVMLLDDGVYRTHWLQPVIDFLLQASDFDVEGRDITGQRFFYQLAGPKSLEILEQATQSDLHDIKFAKHRAAMLDGEEVHILRLGMAGTLAYEIHGDMKQADKIYQKIWELTQAQDGKKLGFEAYCMNHTEAGFPNIMIYYPMPWYENKDFAAYLNARPGAGFFNENRNLVGSVGGELELRYKTPFDVGWGKLVNFNHDFIGKSALLEIAENNTSAVVTLEWNAQDVAAVYATQFEGRDVEPCEDITEPSALKFDTVISGHFTYRADKVMAGDVLVGTSTGRIHSVYYRRILSLGFIHKDYAIEGSELTLIWGSPGTRQLPIRVRITACPYLDLESNRSVSLDSIPRYRKSGA